MKSENQKIKKEEVIEHIKDDENENEIKNEQQELKAKNELIKETYNVLIKDKIDKINILKQFIENHNKIENMIMNKNEIKINSENNNININKVSENKNPMFKKVNVKKVTSERNKINKNKNDEIQKSNLNLYEQNNRARANSYKRNHPISGSKKEISGQVINKRFNEAIKEIGNNEQNGTNGTKMGSTGNQFYNIGRMTMSNFKEHQFGHSSKITVPMQIS